MKKFTVFESSVIGFFIGVIVAAYMTFAATSDAFVGHALSWISLHPLTAYFGLPEDQILVASFLFYILVYTAYVLIIGLIVKRMLKAKAMFIPLALIAGIIGLEQASGAPETYATKQSAPVAAALLAIPKPSAKPIETPKAPERYFGTEAVGDLNNDGQDDIAFFIRRNDPDRGTLYYVAASIATSTGHIGTDLAFIGDRAKPKNIAIDNGVIAIDYTVGSSASVKHIFTSVIDGSLQKFATSSPMAATSTSQTTTTSTATSTAKAGAL